MTFAAPDRDLCFSLAGGIAALYDHWYVTNNTLKTQNEKLARALFIAAPFSLMGVSYFCTREALGRISENLNGDKDHNLSYVFAGVTPSAIYYAFTGKRDSKSIFHL